MEKMTMEKRQFGTLSWKVPVIGFGAAAISGEGGGYGFGKVDEKEAISLIHALLDHGIDLLDTAPAYGYGMSEQRIGKAIQGMRDRVHVVTKCGVTWDAAHPFKFDNSASNVRRMLEESLKRLQTDYIDLYMIHWPSRKIDIREPMQVLSEAKKAGKIRGIGLCNTFPEEIRKAFEVDVVDVVQNEFNLFADAPVMELFPILHEQKIGFMGYGTFDKGILTGRVTTDREKTNQYDKEDLRSWAPWWKETNLKDKLSAMEEIAKLLDETGFTKQELALGFSLSHPEVSTALCGVKSLEQLQSAVTALTHLPPPQVLERARAIADRHLT